MHQTARSVFSLTALAAAAGSALAGGHFTWSGTATGTAFGNSVTGADFTFSIFVQDVSQNLTPGSSIGSYAIQSVQMSVDGGTFTETLGPFDSTLSSVFIDPGSTQLVGASNLFGALAGGASFQIGALLPDGSFADPADLSGATDFLLTGLQGTAFNSYSSDGFELDLDATSFSYESNFVVIPLPQAGALAALGLAGMAVRRRRSREP